jgi:predicted RNA binding protein YcfA (HicA-like mRNA interferase family)
MQKLPRISGKQVVKILFKSGFIPVRQKGSHIILKKEVDRMKKAVVVPNHREIDRGTLLEIIRQAGLKKKDFLRSI